MAGYKLEAVVFDSATPAAGQYDPGPGGDQLQEVHRGPHGAGRGGPGHERRGQGDLADHLRGRHGHDHPELDQPGHHRPEVQGPVPAQGQGGLLPHRDDRRLPGPEHGQLPLPPAQDEERLRPRRRRRLRGGDRRQLRAAGQGAGDQGARARPARPEGGRLQDDPDQDQGHEPGRPLLRRGHAGGGQARPPGLRDHAADDQGRLRRRLRHVLAQAVRARKPSRAGTARRPPPSS